MSETLKDLAKGLKNELRKCDTQIAGYRARKAEILAQIESLRVEAGIDVDE